jgi:hypothetical protein
MILSSDDRLLAAWDLTHRPAQAGRFAQGGRVLRSRGGQEARQGDGDRALANREVRRAAPRGRGSRSAPLTLPLTGLSVLLVCEDIGVVRFTVRRKREKA